jgi:sulfur-carrier protein
MSTVRIPPVLRASVGGARQVEANGATLGAVLDDLFARYAGLREQILAPEGGLSRFVNVFVNDQDARYLQGLATPVQEHDTIVLLPAMAGGACYALPQHH